MSVMKISGAVCAAMILSSCMPGITTRGACNVHMEAFCEKGEGWDTCKRKPRLSDATIDTLPRTQQQQFWTYKTWVVEHCPAKN